MFIEQLNQQDKFFFKNEEVYTIIAWIKNNKELLQTIADKSRQLKKIPSEYINVFKDVGFFDLAREKIAGGYGFSSAEQARVLEEIAKIDTSLSWCIMIGMDSGIYRGFVPEVVREKFFNKTKSISAGWIHPQGVAKNLGDGYINVTGNWQFGSGIDNADIILGGVKYYKNESSEEWEWKIIILEKSKVQINNTWDTWGLEGSGSQHYSVIDLKVPEDYVFSLSQPYLDGPLYTPQDAILRKMPGIPLGVTINCLLKAICSIKRKYNFSDQINTSNQRVLAILGDVASELLSLRSHVYSSLLYGWENKDKENINSSLVHSAGARQRAFSVSRKLVLEISDLLGAQSVYKSQGNIGSLISDLNVICQHAVGQKSIQEMIGYRLIGGNASGPFL